MPAVQTPQKPSSNNRKGFVDFLFDKGIGQGDASYWYQDRGAEESSLSGAVQRGFENPDQRKTLVDYLFDQGLAQGDRNYWYEDRGAENQSLYNTFSQFLGQPLNVPGPETAGSPSGAAGAPFGQEISDLRDQRLAAALQAIDAQFGLQSGTLTNQRGALESLFATGSKDLDRAQEGVETGTAANAANRGIGRSGIYAQNLSRGLGQVADQRADLTSRLNPTEGAEGTEIRQIISALSLLEQQRTATRSQAELDSQADELDLEQYLALLNAGLQTG